MQTSSILHMHMHIALQIFFIDDKLTKYLPEMN